MIPAAIAAAAALAGAAMTAKSVSDTNASNMQLNTNNANLARELQQSQNDYNTQMWERNNEYNDYVSQVERMRKAGVNPAMLFSSSGGIQSSTATSGTGQPAPSPIPMQSSKYDFDSIGPIAQGFEQRRIERSKADIMQYDADIKRMTYLDELLSKTEEFKRNGLDNDNNRALYRMYQLEIDYLTKSMRDRVNQQHFQSEVSRENMLQQQFDTLIQPQRWTMEINQLGSSIGLTRAQTRVAEASIGEIAARIKNLASQTKLNYANVNRVVQDVILRSVDELSVKNQYDALTKSQAAQTVDAVTNYVFDKVGKIASFGFSKKW